VANERYFHSVAEGIEKMEPLDDASILYEGVLKMAQKLNLLTDTSGHVSAWRPEDGSMWISPRQIDRSTMTSDDAVLAKVRGSDVLFAGTQEPSIDAGILGTLYAHPRTTMPAFLHFHGGWGRMKCKTDFSYPCGTWEEYCEIYAAADAANLFSNWNSERSVELVNHGFLLGINNYEQLYELKKTWRIIHSEFAAHLEEVSAITGKAIVFDQKKFRPVWGGVQIVGLIYDDPSAATIYLTAEARGKGIGKVVVGQLIAREYTIRTLELCGVAGYYKKAGFTAYEGEDGFMRLAPPKLKADET